MRSVSPQQQLDLFYSMPGDIAARDALERVVRTRGDAGAELQEVVLVFTEGRAHVGVEAQRSHILLLRLREPRARLRRESRGRRVRNR